MTQEEIIATLKANIGKRVRITFDDDEVQSVDITNIDSEGFVLSGPNGENPAGYWARFESVKLIEPSN